MEIIFKDYNFLDNKINLSIPSNIIIGLTGSTKDAFVSLLSLKNLEKGSLYLGDNKVTKENIKVFRKRIGLLSQNINESFYHLTVKDYLLNEIKLKELSFTDVSKKIKDSLKIVGLNISYLNRQLKSLSYSEKKLLLLANVLLLNPNIIILDEFFLGIDLLNEKKIIRLLLKIQEKYQKTLIIVSKETTCLYNYCKKLIVVNETGILLDGPTEEVLQEVDLLKKNKIELPPILEFTYLAKKKKEVKIDYHQDIRDIIKDIYKHV